MGDGVDSNEADLFAYFIQWIQNNAVFILIPVVMFFFEVCQDSV